MARNDKGRGPRGPQQQGQGRPQQQHGRPQQGGGGGGGVGWTQVRDSVRRDVELAASTLAFAQTLGQRLDAQRRLFNDFPRVMEELRSGALERLLGAMSRLYEGGPNVLDLTRFLRDLPLATAHLAMAEERARKQALANQAQREAKLKAPTGEAAKTATEPAQAEGEAHADENADAGADANAEGNADAGAEANADASADANANANADANANANADADAAANANANAAANANADAAATPAPSTPPPAEHAALSPRLELRSRLLTAAPELAKALNSYRRVVATIRRAASPRRAPGPWRSDREVFEQAQPAVDFAQKIVDAYSEAWNDPSIAKGTHDAVAAEVDRFLAWTQLARYSEVAAPAPSAPPRTDRKIIAPRPEDLKPAADAPTADAAATPESKDETKSESAAAATGAEGAPA